MTGEKITVRDALQVTEDSLDKLASCEPPPTVYQMWEELDKSAAMRKEALATRDPGEEILAYLKEACVMLRWRGEGVRGSSSWWSEVERLIAKYGGDEGQNTQ